MLSSLAFLVLIVGAAALDCNQIPDDQIVAGHTVIIPSANESAVLPPNYRCIYRVTVPPMMYAHVQLANKLKGNNDLITVLDEQSTKTVVSSRSAQVVHFYVFPNTTTTFDVSTKSVDMHSSFRLVVYYRTMLPAETTLLYNPADFKYFMLNHLRVNSYYAPQRMVAKEQISLSLAYSGWDAELLDNFFVIDGDFENPKNVYRMPRFIHQNFVSSGNTLTVVGLDNRVSESSVVFTLLSEVQKYDSVTAIGTYFAANELDINAKTGGKQKTVVNVIGMNDYTRVLNVARSSDPNCSVKAVSAPVSENSQVYFDFVTGDFPRNITHKSFSIVAEKCAASITMVSLNYDSDSK